MVGDRQERYKKEAALKKKEEDDVSSTQAKLREKIEELQRKLEGVSIVETSRIPASTLTPNDLIASDE
jgi:N12 class adenine-specific DNA methylase